MTSYLTGISIDFSGPNEFDIIEGDIAGVVLEALGVSFGEVPVTITPLPCSEYSGNLSELFSNVPQDSADPGMLLSCGSQLLYCP